MLPPPDCEIIPPGPRRGRLRAALFDFDGTLSLLREGWPTVMAGLGVELLREAGSVEPDESLHARVIEGVMRLNGRPTLEQMGWLAGEARRLGGGFDPADAKAEYTARLSRVVEERAARIIGGHDHPGVWAVPGAHAMLEALRRRGVVLTLASGTDVRFVRREAELLGVAGYFGDGLFAPASDGDGFSKRGVIADILAGGVAPDELVGFGDGWVETEEIRRVGGVAVGVASDEAGRGPVNTEKRGRLLDAGANVIVPDYRHAELLAAWLCGESGVSR